MNSGSEINSYRDLRVWQAARMLVGDIYKATAGYPNHEIYGLSSQTRRAAVSVPSNIAEGYGRGSLGDYIRFLQTSRGSLYELQTQLLIGQDLGYLSDDKAQDLIAQADNCAIMLHGLLAKLHEKKTSQEGPKK